MTAPEVELVRAVRNGVTESVHRGHVVLAGVDGRVLAALGDPRRSTYVRSAVKPFQALAVLDLLASGGVDLDDHGLAIACASHDGTDDQQIEAARLLAEASLDEEALQCPAAMPRDADTAWTQRWPYPLAHNCSGKHAAFLYATVVVGADPAAYLSLGNPLQRRIRERLATASSEEPAGPGVDGCGAPAWLLPLAGLATAFARLAAGSSPELERVRNAMTKHPELIGGPASVDTALMQADADVVAKRGAEAVFAAGVSRGADSIGIAVKITDGGQRADGPVAASVLSALGCTTPDTVRRPDIMGGGRVQGALEVSDDVTALAARTGA